MTSLPDRPNTALLVIDVQNDVVANAHKRDEVIATKPRRNEAITSEQADGSGGDVHPHWEIL